MREYRIVQTGDSRFIVEKAVHHTKRGCWPWSPRVYSHTEWVPAFGFPGHPWRFHSLAAAEKWLDDLRKYPIVVKEPA